MQHNECHAAGSCRNGVVIKRVSRELDRFTVLLTQIEMTVSEIVENAKDELGSETSVCLQSIDEICQVSYALSALLQKMSKRGAETDEDIVADVFPSDLRARLLDRNIDDVDNTMRSIEYF